MQHTNSISETLQSFQAQISGDLVTIADILEGLHERGFGFVLLIFALPMAMPLPVPPGVNVLLASPLVLLTAQQALGRHTIWVPEWFKAKSVSRETIDGFLNKAIPLLRKVEILVKPRLEFVTRGVFSNLIGVLGLLMALTTAIPVPLTNTVPCIGISIMAIGVLSRDGLAVIGGALIGIVWIAILALAIIFLGAEGIDFVKDVIKSWL